MKLNRPTHRIGSIALLLAGVALTGLAQTYLPESIRSFARSGFSYSFLHAWSTNAPAPPRTDESHRRAIGARTEFPTANTTRGATIPVDATARFNARTAADSWEMDTASRSFYIAQRMQQLHGFRNTDVAATAALTSTTTATIPNDPAWTGPSGTASAPTSGNWSVATNWDPNGVPASSDTTVLAFGGSGSTPYTSTNDLGAFTFGTIVLNSSATATETITGNTLAVGAGALPNFYSGSTIQQNGSGAFEIQNNITANTSGSGLTYQLHLTSDATTGTGTVTLSGAISDGDALHRLSVVKDGPNTVVVTGANTYSGSTNITGGTLLVNNTSGSGTGTGNVIVNGTGTLGGTGSIIVSTPAEGVSIVEVSSGGTMAPGNGPNQIGTLTLQVPQTIFLSGGTFLVDLNSTSSDLLSMSGVLNLNPGAIIDFNELATPSVPSYTLATYNSVIGTFMETNVPSGYTLVYNPNELDLVAVPEPGTWAAGAMSLAFVGWTQRRRVRKLLRVRAS